MVEEWHVEAGHGKAWSGAAGLGAFWYGMAGFGKAWIYFVVTARWRRDGVWSSQARYDMAR